MTKRSNRRYPFVSLAPGYTYTVPVTSIAETHKQLLRLKSARTYYAKKYGIIIDVELTDENVVATVIDNPMQRRKLPTEPVAQNEPPVPVVKESANYHDVYRAVFVRNVNSPDAILTAHETARCAAAFYEEYTRESSR